MNSRAVKANGRQSGELFDGGSTVTNGQALRQKVSRSAASGRLIEKALVVASGNDRRGAIRPRVLKGGTIITDAESSEIACTLRNQHAHGAELRVPPETVLPSEFLVYVPLDDIAYEAEIIWRRNERVGVRFVGTQPKPRFHYG